jgi:hypothetical protein
MKSRIWDMEEGERREVQGGRKMKNKIRSEEIFGY